MHGRPGDIIICKSKISQFCLHVCVQAAFKVLADRYGIFPQKTRKKTIKVGESICSDVIHEFFLWQEWAGIQAGYARQMTMHALDLTNRSQGSRCFLGVCFLFFVFSSVYLNIFEGMEIRWRLRSLPGVPR